MLKHTKRGILILLGCFAIVSFAKYVFPQKRIRYQFYHGKQGSSKIVKKIVDGKAIPFDENRDHITVPPDCEICVEIINSHPVFYSYRVGVEVTPLEIKPPDLSSFLDFINNLIEKTEIAQIKARTLTKDLQTWLENYVQKITTLADIIEEAQLTSNKSEEPAEYPFKETSYERARKDIYEKLGDDISLFEGMKPEEAIKKWYKDALGAIPTLNDQPLVRTYRTIVDALYVYSQTLLELRNSVLKSYEYDRPFIRECIKIGDGLTTVRLKINNKSEKKTDAVRDTGDTDLLEIVAMPEFKRPRMEIVPVAYYTFVKDYSEFSVIDGIVNRTMDNERFEFRFGAMLATNVYSFSKSKELALSIGLGSNLFGGGKALSEYFLGAFISYRDIFRFGLGWGAAKIPELKGGAVVGQPLPQGKSLDDFLGHDDKSAIFIVFSLKGINFLSLIK